MVANIQAEAMKCIQSTGNQGVVEVCQLSKTPEVLLVKAESTDGLNDKTIIAFAVETDDGTVVVEYPFPSNYFDVLTEGAEVQKQ